MISAFLAGAAVASAAAAPGTFGVGISPAVVSGPASSTATFTVRDAGSTPEHVTVQAVEERPVTGGGWTPWHAYPQATVSPSALSLKAGQSRMVKVTVHSTDGYHHRLAITAAAKPLTVKSGAAVTPAVAAAYTIPGKPNPYAGPVALAAPVKPGQFPWLPVGLAAAGAAGLAGLVTAGRKLRITRR